MSKALKSAIKEGLSLEKIAQKLGYANGTTVRRLIQKQPELFELYYNDPDVYKIRSQTHFNAISIKSRMRNQEHIIKTVENIKKLLLDGLTKKKIIKQLRISKATLNKTIRESKELSSIWYNVKPENPEFIGQGLRSTLGSEFIDRLSTEEIVRLKDCWRLWIRKKQECRNRKIKFDMPFMLVEFPEFCPVTKCKLIYTKQRMCNDKATIDRIDPSKGYVLSNIRIISHRANRLKNNASIHDLKQLIKYMKDCERLKHRFHFNKVLVNWRALNKKTDLYSNVPMYGKITYYVPDQKRLAFT